ncbi:hypothetical protein ACOSQ2_019148 [Xanthoceras sorbifolium]
MPFLLHEDRSSSSASLSSFVLPLPSLGRSRAAGSFPGQLTGVAWEVRIRGLGDAGVLGIGAVETRGGLAWLRLGAGAVSVRCCCLSGALVENACCGAAFVVK